jgi:hypothetical protein
MVTVIIGVIGAVIGGLITWIVKDFLQETFFNKRAASRLYKMSLILFMEKSRLPELLWSDKNINDEVRQAIQLIHLVPIYKEFHNILIKRLPLQALDFKEPDKTCLEGSRSEKLSFYEAEIQTICHVSKFLWDSGVHDRKQIKPTAYLFEDSSKIYDFPAKYWVCWLEKNGFKFKFKKYRIRK